MHPRPACVARAPRGIARSWKRDPRPFGLTLGPMLAAACLDRMKEVMMRAHRARALLIAGHGTDDTHLSAAPLLIVAVDAGPLARRDDVMQAIRAGRAIAWLTRRELGTLVGDDDVALCGVTNDTMARELQVLRLAADGGTAKTREGAGCSRAPEAR